MRLAWRVSMVEAQSLDTGWAARRRPQSTRDIAGHNGVVSSRQTAVLCARERHLGGGRGMLAA